MLGSLSILTLLYGIFPYILFNISNPTISTLFK
jgi:hypothetical protein